MSSPPPQRVAVASDQSLVAESVRAALSNRGFHALSFRWPDVADKARTPVGDPQRGKSPPEVGLLISELDQPARITVARRVVTGLPVPWLVLTGARAGPAWGALLDSGARLVLPSSTTLDEVATLLPGVASGRRRTPARRRRIWVDQWQRQHEQMLSVVAALGEMTPRETEVLQRLYAGETVASIAEQWGVSAATVRSQVKSVLRKLGVTSQLAAVAAYDLVDRD